MGACIIVYVGHEHRKVRHESTVWHVCPRCGWLLGQEWTWEHGWRHGQCSYCDYMPPPEQQTEVEREVWYEDAPGDGGAREGEG